jgi:hypothetical protein
VINGMLYQFSSIFESSGYCRFGPDTGVLIEEFRRFLLFFGKQSQQESACIRY